MISEIEKRRSIRKYKSDSVSDEVIKDILTAAMMAPSAMNSRPWHFFVVRNREVLDKMSTLTPFVKMLKEAPCAVVVCRRSDLPARLGGIEFWPQDCAAAIENMLLEATSLGLGRCWCGFYPVAKASKALADLLETEDTPMSVVALGYPNEEGVKRGFYEESKVRFID